MSTGSEVALQSQIEQVISDAVHGITDTQTAAELVLEILAPAAREMSAERGQGFLDAVTMLDLGRKRRASRWLRRLRWYEQALAAVDTAPRA